VGHTVPQNASVTGRFGWKLDRVMRATEKGLLFLPTSCLDGGQATAWVNNFRITKFASAGSTAEAAQTVLDMDALTGDETLKNLWPSSVFRQLADMLAVEVPLRDEDGGSLATKTKIFDALLLRTGNVPMQPAAMAGWKPQLQFLEASNFCVTAPPGHSMERMFYILNDWSTSAAPTHASLAPGKVADIILKTIARLHGDVAGNIWPYLVGPLAPSASLSILAKIVETMPTDKQLRIQTIHPASKTALFDMGTGSEDAASLQLWDTFNSMGPTVLNAITTAYPPAKIFKSTESAAMDPTEMITKIMATFVDMTKGQSAAMASALLEKSEDPDAVKAGRIGNAKWIEWVSKPANIEIIKLAMEIQLEQGEDKVLDHLICQPSSFRALLATMAPSTADLNTSLGIIFKARKLQETKFEAIMYLAHKGHIDHTVGPPSLPQLRCMHQHARQPAHTCSHSRHEHRPQGGATR